MRTEAPAKGWNDGGGGGGSWVCGADRSGRRQRQQVEKSKESWMPSVWLEKHRWDLSHSRVPLGCHGNSTLLGLGKGLIPSSYGSGTTC